MTAIHVNYKFSECKVIQQQYLDEFTSVEVPDLNSACFTATDDDLREWVLAHSYSCDWLSVLKCPDTFTGVSQPHLTHVVLCAGYDLIVTDFHAEDRVTVAAEYLLTFTSLQ